MLGLILQQKTVPIEVWIEYLKDQKTFWLLYTILTAFHDHQTTNLEIKFYIITGDRSSTDEDK